MGDPRKVRKKYLKPTHMWQKARIDEETALLSSYGLANKREIWKASSLLRNYTRQAKRLIAMKSAQSEKESEQLLTKLESLGLIKARNLESVLDISLKNILERRLQSVIMKRKIAISIKQARQMITHAHISVADRKVTSPSFLVSVADEEKIGFVPDSPFAKADHPIKQVEAKA